MGVFFKDKKYRIKEFNNGSKYFRFRVETSEYLFLGAYGSWSYDKGFQTQAEAEKYVEALIAGDPDGKPRVVKTYK